jgi:glycine/D-amino acid oxidase-like deaminating enzyme
VPTPSFWLDELARPPARPERPPLPGNRDADVCIVGAGYTGLWTAYELARAAPGLSIVVLEARYAGFGASGRNGGWVVGTVSGSTGRWRARGGRDAPRAMAAAIQATVEEIGAVVEREGIECDWRLGGTLSVAQSEPQLRRITSQARAEREDWGEELAGHLIGAEELRGRVAVEGGLGALFHARCARVQPARLVAGLAAAAERAGVTIHESTRVHAIEPGVVRAATGTVRARHAIRALEGYTADLPGQRRTLLPMNSSMIVTEPLDPATWARLGWDGAETIADGAHVYTYSQRTADGRIAIGGRGVPYRFGSRTDREGPVPAETVDALRARLAALFPSLSGVAVARSWHGVLGVARDWCPFVSFDPVNGLGAAGGYTGDGVAASNLAARTLRDLVLGRDSELTRLPWVGRGARDWEPEPLRFVGARGVYALYRLADRWEAAGGRGGPVAGLADLVAGR